MMKHSLKHSALIALSLTGLMPALAGCQPLQLDGLIVPQPSASPLAAASPRPDQAPLASPSGFSGPTALPTLYPGGPIPDPTVTPSPWNGMPTATPWGSPSGEPSGYASAYPVVTPTPGTESITEFKDSDVTARRESRVLERYVPSPDGSRALFRYSRQLEADLRGWFYNPAMRSVSSDLWLHDSASGGQRELGPVEGLSAWTPFYWINGHTIAWIHDSGAELLSLDLDTGLRSSLYRGERLLGLRRHAGRLFFTASGNGKQHIVRLNPLTGETLLTALPYADFYDSGAVAHPLGDDLVLVGQSKQHHQAGNYPFRVMMTATPAPPLSDSYLVSLGDGRAEPVQGGLDLSAPDAVSMSADLAHALVQQSDRVTVYTRAGERVLEATGRGSWLDPNHLILLEPLAISIRRLSDGATTYRASTQNRCTDVQRSAAGGTLLQCEVRLNGRSLSRVYLLNGTGPLQELALGLPDSGRAVLAEGRVMAHVPGTTGHSTAWGIDAQGRPQSELRLSNPLNPQFRFDPHHVEPNQGLWTGSYGQSSYPY